MSGFADQMIVRFLEDTFTLNFLGTRIGATALFNTSYDPTDFTLNDVKVSQVVRREFEAPTFESIRTTGSNERITPQPSERIRTERSIKNYGRLVWAEVAIEAILGAVVQSTVLAPDSIQTKDLLSDLGGATTLPQLKTKLLARYASSQVDEIFKRLRITTIEEFKERMNLLVKFLYKEPPAFDANDPANAKDFPVSVCVKFQADLNLSDALQNAKLCRSVRERERDFDPAVNGADVKTPFVFITVFPDTVAVDNAIPGLTAAQIRTSVQSLFAAEGMLAHFFVP